MEIALTERSRDHIIGNFAETLTVCVEQMNEVCRKFFEYINGQVFANEKEWQDALSSFKTSVMSTAGGTRSEKQMIYDQIESMLLNPSKLVTGRRQIDQNVVRFLMQGSSDTSLPATKCAVCDKSGGVMVRCSFHRCKKPLHIACAASTKPSKKFRCRYYRCPLCQPAKKSDEKRPIRATRRKRKRDPPKKAIEKQKCDSNGGGASKDDAAAALREPSPVASDGSTSSNSDEERTGSSLDESESGQIFDGDGHATHGISFKSACEINSMSFGQRHEAKVVTPAKDTSDGSMSDVSSISDSGEGQLEDNVLCKRGQQTDPNNGLVLSSVFNDACSELFFIKNTIHCVREDLQIACDSVQSHVSQQNAVQVRTVLTQIRSGLNMLTTLARQFQHAYRMPLVDNFSSNADSHGGGVGASDVLSDAYSEVSLFERHVSTLHEQFEVLQSQSVGVVS
jgi:hypothetical protein